MLLLKEAHFSRTSLDVEEQPLAVERGAAAAAGAAVEQCGQLRLTHAARVRDERATGPDGAESAKRGHTFERTRDVHLLALRELPSRGHVAT